MNSIEKLSQANRMLAEAATLEDIQIIRGIAQMAAEYARAAKLGLEAQNTAAEIKLRAERKAGELLTELKRETPQTARIASELGHDSEYAQALEESNTSRQDANRWQQVAAIPAPIFERFIEETIDAGQELTTNRAVRVAREITRGSASLASAEAPPMPEEKYRVWYADPPWHYGNSGVIGESDNYGRAERHYPTMTIDELMAMGDDIKDRCDDNAVLFMWVTSPLLEECFDVIRAWGFKYKTSFVWDKIKHNFGHYNSVRHEFLLVCTRGSCLPDVPTLIDSVVEIERSNKHSQKPEQFRDMINALYPIGQRIELFARESASGWETWGNESKSAGCIRHTG